MAKVPTSIPAPPPPPAPAVETVVDDTPVVPPPPPPDTPPEPTAPPVDNEHVAEGATPFTPAEVQAGAVATESNTQLGPGEVAPPETVSDGGVNGPVTKNAEKHGATKAADFKASDPDADDEFAEVPEDKFGKRQQEISKSAFKAGRNGTRLGKRRKSMTDAEWSVYQAAYARGVTQKEADELDDEDRLARIERALGLAVPGAVVYEEDDE